MSDKQQPTKTWINKIPEAILIAGLAAFSGYQTHAATTTQQIEDLERRIEALEKLHPRAQ